MTGKRSITDDDADKPAIDPRADDDSAEKAQHQEDSSEIGDRVGGPRETRERPAPELQSVKPDVR